MISQSSAVASRDIASTTPLRKARLSLDFKNSHARVIEPEQASIAMRAVSIEAPVFWRMMPAASVAGMWRNGTTWQRETIVGSTLSRVRPKRTIITLAGGTSSVFRKAFAAAVPSISTRSRI